MPAIRCAREPAADGDLRQVFGQLRRTDDQHPVVHLDDGLVDPPATVVAVGRVGDRVQDPRALRFLADIVGPDRIMMGSDMPFPIGDLAPIERGRQPLGRVTIWSDFPLGLWRGWAYVHFPLTGVVYPAPETPQTEEPSPDDSRGGRPHPRRRAAAGGAVDSTSPGTSPPTGCRAAQRQ